MTEGREPGATFAPGAIGWLDFEARSSELIKAGATRYASAADAIVAAYAIGDGPVRAEPVSDFSAPLRWAEMPADFRGHHDRVMRGEAVWAAWNAGFDRAIWNYATIGFPYLAPQHCIDVMAQATASGLAPDLAMAAKQSGSTPKDDSGADLIKLFCLPTSTATPQSHPEAWFQFSRVYAPGDILSMRSVFAGTRQLPLAEWQEYWAMEAVNERGIRIDTELVAHAATLAAEDKRRSAKLLHTLTKGRVFTVDQVKRMTEWLLELLPVDGRSLLIKREPELDDDGALVKPAKYALTRARVERLIALVKYTLQTNEAADDDPLWNALRVLQIRLYGGSKTPAKFARMLEQQVDGVLYGQYVFNGAPQTGRASSKGVQVHNLARDALPAEIGLLKALESRVTYDAFAGTGGDDPVARKLSLLIRPMFEPAPGNVFVWSDWSQIEARITPWLADHFPGARERLALFAAVDADPSVPDLYTRSAAEISHIPVAQVTKAIRQRGKVAELALTFCGGVNALQNMAANYGLYLPDDEAKTIVTRWREANSWVMDFASELWNAMLLARRVPGHYCTAGRIGFVFLADYLGGSLLCRLPSGRFLTYRCLREERVEILDDDDEVIGHKLELTFRRGYGRVTLWPGLLVENFTQATAADVLRGTLVRLEDERHEVRLHTHDEILLEVPEQIEQAIAVALREIMQRGFDWSEGLPLMSEETIAPYYTKQEVET